jgi:hypothetical protein
MASSHAEDVGSKRAGFPRPYKCKISMTLGMRQRLGEFHSLIF